MEIPKYFEMYRSFLRSLSDGREHSYTDCKNQIVSDFALTDDDMAEMLPSGRQSIFNNRVSWCKTYLKKAGLIDSPSRARFVITEAGKQIYESTDEITNDTLRKFPSFVEFIGGNVYESRIPASTDESRETPRETLERVHGELNEALADELLTKIHQNSPVFFEQMIISLMERMGYGYGKVTQQSRDGEIDGIVYQDKLGFDIIYIQAKRYDIDKIVGRPELQKFAGAIPGSNAKGLFVTTASFSSDAKEYAKDRHIILIDGQRLAKLMIEHEFGVTTEYVYKIKRIDQDLFLEDE